MRGGVYIVDSYGIYLVTVLERFLIAVLAAYFSLKFKFTFPLGT